MYSGGKIIRIDEIAVSRRLMHGHKTVLVGGCFDIFHYGHLHFLTEAKRKGDALIVLLESDAFIEKSKKKKPVHTQMQRAELLAALICVDEVILLTEMKDRDKEYKKIVLLIHPSVIAYTKGDSGFNKKVSLANEVRAEIVEVDSIQSFSSSQLITYAPILGD